MQANACCLISYETQWSGPNNQRGKSSNVDTDEITSGYSPAKLYSDWSFGLIHKLVTYSFCLHQLSGPIIIAVKVENLRCAKMMLECLGGVVCICKGHDVKLTLLRIGKPLTTILDCYEIARCDTTLVLV